MNIKELELHANNIRKNILTYVNNEDWQDVVKDAGVFLRDKLDKGFE